VENVTDVLKETVSGKAMIQIVDNVLLAQKNRQVASLTKGGDVMTEIPRMFMTPAMRMVIAPVTNVP
jgi:hypothetical protein